MVQHDSAPAVWLWGPSHIVHLWSRWVAAGTAWTMLVVLIVGSGVPTLQEYLRQIECHLMSGTVQSEAGTGVPGVQVDYENEDGTVSQSYEDVIKGIPGLKHYYALDNVSEARDLIGGANGTVHGSVAFRADGAHFDGKSYIELPDSDDFSVTTTKELTVIAFLTVDDWKHVSHNNEYLHWMGKGKAGAHEWTFRTYVDGGGGEAPARKRRISFYNFTPSGGLGTGSFVQDPHAAEGVEVVIGGVATTKGSGRTPGYSAMYCNGIQRDKDMFTSYSTVPANTATPVCIGSRGDNTGFLVGRIRRVAVFNRVLTDAEMKSIYDAQRLPERTATPVPTPTPAAAQIAAQVAALRGAADALEKIGRSLG